LDKILRDAGVKLSSVASDILGVCGRAMLAGLVSGTTDADVLADLALGQLRHMIPALRAALTSRFSAHHAVIVSAILSKLELLDEFIAGLTSEIEAVIGPFSHATNSKIKSGTVRLVYPVAAADRVVSSC
jgi:transposase